VSAKGIILAAAAATALAAAAGAYLFLSKKGSVPILGGTQEQADPSAFEGEDVEDSLAVESGADGGPQVEGDPWLDPGENAEPIEGSGDFVEGEEPFEDVYDPAAEPVDRGDPPPSDPIDPSEPSADPPADGAAAEPSEPGR